MSLLDEMVNQNFADRQFYLKPAPMKLLAELFERTYRANHLVENGFKRITMIASNGYCMTWISIPIGFMNLFRSGVCF